MLTDEFLRRYRQGQRSFTNDLVSDGLGGMSLAGHTLTGLRLRSIQFSGVDFTDTILDEMECSRVRFEGALLVGASLQRAQLSEVVWQDRSLDRVNLTDANLSHAQLQGCSFRDAILVRTNCTSANFRAAKLQGADLREARLERAVLEEVEADERTRWPEDVMLLRGVRLSPGMTVVKLIGRKVARGGALQHAPALMIPIPGGKAVTREKIQQAILQDWHTRVEQPAFRRELLHRYQGRCAISGSEIVDALDAAHIIPYKIASGREKGAWTNGLPLRADLHRLFDLGKIWVDPETYIVSFDADVRCSPEYQLYHHRQLMLPIWPMPAAEYEARLRQNLQWRKLRYRECLAGICEQIVGEEAKPENNKK